MSTMWVRFYPAYATGNVLGWCENELFRKLWPIVKPHTVSDPFRAHSLINHVESVLEMPGNLIQCGVAEGGTGLMMAMALREHGSGKKIFLCDSFQGLPPPREGMDDFFLKGQFRVEDEQNIYRLIRDYGLEDYVEVYHGWFADTLPTIAPDAEFCFAHVDVDLHDSAVECVDQVYPKLVDGGIMAFDEYNHISPGVRIGVNKHLERTGEVIHLGPLSESFLIKGMTPDSCPFPTFERMIENSAIHLATDRLQRDSFYRRFQREHLPYLQRRIAAFGDHCRMLGEDASGARE